jgi:predicted RNA binding protein YcfA (HicA-like mRNA interferase family)
MSINNSSYHPAYIPSFSGGKGAVGNISSSTLKKWAKKSGFKVTNQGKGDHCSILIPNATRPVTYSAHQGRDISREEISSLAKALGISQHTLVEDLIRKSIPYHPKDKVLTPSGK